jgi:hypothetical protein
VVLVACAVLLAELALLGAGDVALPARGADAARVCARHAPRSDRVLLARCARIRGRVLWTSDHGGDVHAAVVARWHLFVVKLPDGGRPPARLAHVVVTGPLVRARNGLREVEAFALVPA